MRRRMESFLCFLQIMFVVLVLHHHTCDASTITNNQPYYCPPSSCGKITNIKYPFRLKNDPTTCGDPRYELSCENNMTMLTLFSGKYYVKSIDYKNYTIRLVDPGIEDGDCSSIPQYFLTKSNFTSYYNSDYHGDPYEVGTGSQSWLDHIIYLNCSKRVKNDPMYVDTSPCVQWNSEGHVYAIAGDIKTRSLNVGCQVKLVAMSSASALKPNFVNYSYLEIHEMLGYGFYVSWIRRACEDSCDVNQQDCYLGTGSLECGVYICTSPLGEHTVVCEDLSKLRILLEGIILGIIEDVIGLLTGVGQEREVTNQNGTTTKLNVIALEADGSKIQCTLFGSYVDELNAFLGAGDGNNAIVIMQFAKAKNFQDKIHIQNCINCSVLIFNSSCPKSVAFKLSLSENIDTPSPMGLTQIGCESRVEPKDEFLNNTPRITLQSLRDSGSEGFHVVAATIKRVLNPDSFWYTACVCNKAVIPDSKMFFCEKCDKHVVRVFPRFCIKVRVMDNTDSAIFVIFDKDASSLFDLSCADMVHALQTGAQDGVVPALLDTLVDKTWLFKVECKANQNQRFEQSFRVRKLCTDADIIQAFHAKWDHEDAAVVKSINECGSMSTLVGKGKDVLICGSSNVMNEDCESLSARDAKGKGVFVEATQVGEFTQDLMNKFVDAVVDLSDDSSPTFGKTNNVSAVSEKVCVQGNTDDVITTPAVVDLSDDSSPTFGKTNNDSAVSNKVSVQGKNDEVFTTPVVKGQRKKSVAKRVSPKSNEVDEDDNAPIKLLKRPVKIEKI